MNEKEAFDRSRILEYMRDKMGLNAFQTCKQLAIDLEMDKATVVTYCQDLSSSGYLQFNSNLQGGDVRLIEKGFHYLNQGGPLKDYDDQLKRSKEKREEKERQDIVINDQLTTNRATRRSYWWSIGISLFALALATLSFLSQILRWFPNT